MALTRSTISGGSRSIQRGRSAGASADRGTPLPVEEGDEGNDVDDEAPTGAMGLEG